MASAPAQLVGQIVQQGQVVAQAILGQLQQQIQQLLQQAIGSISALVGSIGGRGDLSGLFDQITALLNTQINQVLGQVLAGLSGLIGGTFLSFFLLSLSSSLLHPRLGRASVDIGAILSGFLGDIQGALTGLGQHFLNQGLAAVLGGLGSLGGSRAIGDIFACE